MKVTVVDQLYNEFQDIIGKLDNSEVSLRSSAEEAFRKNLLLAAASYFEDVVKAQILNLVRKHAGENETIISFVRNRAIERQFHTYFDWKKRNANSFFGYFGEGFKSYMVERVESDRAYDESVRAFLELGNERNRLVHQNFGSFRLQKTTTEVFELYRVASLFVNSLESSFEDYLRSNSSAQGNSL